MTLQKRPIRVGIISPCPPPYGGVTRYVGNHLAHWDSGDVSAHFLPITLPQTPEVFDGAVFHNLQKDGQDRSWRGVTSYAAVLARAPVTRPSAIRRFVRYNRALEAHVRREQLDVIYAHGVWPAGASAVLQSRISGVKSVVVAYGETFGTTSQHRRWKRMSKYVCNGANHVVATSEHCLRGATVMGAQPDRSSVVYAGVNLNEFKPGLDGSSWRARLGIPTTAVVITVLGLVLRRKLDEFLSAVSSIESSNEVVCVIAGRGPDESYVRERMGQLDGPRIVLPGFIPDDDLPEFYAATDVLVVSQNSELECMGQSMKEAMACGRAVVGAAIGGVPEAITHGVDGVLYESGEPKSLARALSMIVDDPQQRDRLGLAARSNAVSRFEARVSANKTLDIFRSVVGTPEID